MGSAKQGGSRYLAVPLLLGNGGCQDLGLLLYDLGVGVNALWSLLGLICMRRESSWRHSLSRTIGSSAPLVCRHSRGNAKGLERKVFIN